MARKRLARPDEVESVLVSAAERYNEALLSRSAPKVIRAHIEKLRLAVQYWEELLEFRSRTPRKEFRNMLRHSVAAAVELARQKQGRLTSDDLESLQRSLDHSISWMSGTGEIEETPLSLKQRLGLLRAWSGQRAPYKPQRFKKLYEQAYYERSRAVARGEGITGKALARKYLPERFKEDPENALRSMHRALSRIEKEHTRCLQQGVPSPFVTEESGGD